MNLLICTQFSCKFVCILALLLMFAHIFLVQIEIIFWISTITGFIS